MKKVFKRFLFVWLAGILVCCSGACAKKTGYKLSPQEAQYIQSRLEYAESLYAKGDYDQAQNVLEEIINQDPDNVRSPGTVYSILDNPFRIPGTSTHYH